MFEVLVGSAGRFFSRTGWRRRIVSIPIRRRMATVGRRSLPLHHVLLL